MLTTDLSATYDDFVAYSGDGELNENVASLYEGLESTDANLANVQSQIVTSGNIESGNTATSAHTVGTYIQWKGKFYVVTSAIAVGDTLAVGTNLAAKTVGDVLTQINADLTDINSDLSKYQFLHKTYPANTDHITVIDSNRFIDGAICSLPNWYNDYGVTISSDMHSAYITVRDSNGNQPAASLDVTILLKFQ
jgi:hypothetical protein